MICHEIRGIVRRIHQKALSQDPKLTEEDMPREANKDIQSTKDAEGFLIKQLNQYGKSCLWNYTLILCMRAAF